MNDDPHCAFRAEGKGVSVETRGGGTGERGKQGPDREEPAVLLGRQTNQPNYNNNLNKLIDVSDRFPLTAPGPRVSPDRPCDSPRLLFSRTGTKCRPPLRLYWPSRSRRIKNNAMPGTDLTGESLCERMTVSFGLRVEIVSGRYARPEGGAQSRPQTGRTGSEGSSFRVFHINPTRVSPVIAPESAPLTAAPKRRCTSLARVNFK
jgi:hypothetical protein